MELSDSEKQTQEIIIATTESIYNNLLKKIKFKLDYARDHEDNFNKIDYMLLIKDLYNDLPAEINSGYEDIKD
jgi:hypothetical protein